MLTPRARTSLALSHGQPDRPPLDLGGSICTGIVKRAYERLVDYLGLRLDREPRVLHVPFQIVEVAEPVLERLHIDTRPIFANPPRESQAGFLSDGRYRDEWGIVYKPVTSHNVLLYYDMVEHPFADALTAREIAKKQWPNPEDSGHFEGLQEKAQKLQERSSFAIVGDNGDTSLFETAWGVRGFANFLTDLLRKEDLVHLLMHKVLEIQSRRMALYLAEVGQYLDVVCVADDICYQQGPLMSPKVYRKMVKPYHQEFFQLIKANTKAKLHLHCCGAVQDVLDEFADMGVDIINPVQISAKGMNPENLKKRFGDRIAFWGGIDTQNVLPSGAPDDIRKEVRRMIRILGKDGGYVLGAVHNIQNDVPPENIVAMFDEAYELGAS